jgi:hypothetical protein
MAIEVSAVCRLEPNAGQVARLAGPLVSMVLHSPVIHARVDEEPGHWKVLWGGTTAVVDQDPPGRFEYAEHWHHNVAAGERGIDLSLLLMYMTAASIAIVGDGWIVDDSKMVGVTNWPAVSCRPVTSWPGPPETTWAARCRTCWLPWAATSGVSSA